MLVQLKHVILAQDCASRNFVINISLDIKIHEPLITLNFFESLILFQCDFISQLLLLPFISAVDQMLMFIRNYWVDELEVIADSGLVNFSSELLLDFQFLLFFSRLIFLVLLLLSLFISPFNTFLFFFNLTLNIGELSWL